MSKLSPQLLEEVGHSGYNYRWDMDWRDLFGVTIGANTDKAFSLAGVVAGDHILEVHLHLTTPFSDASDTAFNSITLDFGDTSSATRYLSGVQIDVNGTEVIDSYMDPGSDFVYTGADTLIVNFNSMSAKDLTNVDTGALYLEFRLNRNSHPLKNPIFS